MGIFGDILGKIFPSSHPAVAGAANTSAPAPAATAAPAGTPVPSSSPVAAMPEVDVEKVLSGMAAKNPEKLNWQTSIVDLMKLLGLDSSLSARKALASELHFTGDMGDSASMNMWLQKEVMGKLAANGGKLPDSLKS